MTVTTDSSSRRTHEPPNFSGALATAPSKLTRPRRLMGAGIRSCHYQSGDWAGRYCGQYIASVAGPLAAQAWCQTRFQNQDASGAIRQLSIIVLHYGGRRVVVPSNRFFASPLRVSSGGRTLSRALGMAGTDPSEVFLDLNSVSEPSTAGEICSRLARATNRHARPRNHLRLVASKHHDANAAGTGLPAERINQCMLLLLLICVVLAGSIVGAVGYLVSE
jgi:hypothetical protein